MERKKNQPNISLVISTYNWVEALEQVIKGVLRQTVLPDEIIVADDGSDTATKDFLKRISVDSPIPVKHVWQIKGTVLIHSDEEYLVVTRIREHTFYIGNF